MRPFPLPGLSRNGLNNLAIDFGLNQAKVLLPAESVEKVQMANSDYFGTIKNQQLTGHRKPQTARN
jgi:hypothetical protein